MEDRDECRRLRSVLAQAKRARLSGHRHDLLGSVEPLIEALEQSLDMNRDCPADVRALLATLRLRPYYPSDPSQGSDPIAMRWVVWKTEAFHRLIEQLRSKYPDRSDFGG